MPFGCRLFFLEVLCKDGGNVYVEGYGRLSVHDGSLDVRGFVCTRWVVRWRVMNVSRLWLVKVRVRWETGGFVWKLSDSSDQHA